MIYRKLLPGWKFLGHLLRPHSDGLSHAFFLTYPWVKPWELWFQEKYWQWTFVRYRLRRVLLLEFLLHPTPHPYLLPWAGSPPHPHSVLPSRFSQHRGVCGSWVIPSLVFPYWSYSYIKLLSPLALLFLFLFLFFLENSIPSDGPHTLRLTWLAGRQSLNESVMLHWWGEPGTGATQSRSSCFSHLPCDSAIGGRRAVSMRRPFTITL